HGHPLRVGLLDADGGPDQAVEVRLAPAAPHPAAAPSPDSPSLIMATRPPPTGLPSPPRRSPGAERSGGGAPRVGDAQAVDGGADDAAGIARALARRVEARQRR